MPGTFAALQAATPEDTQAALTQGARVSYGTAHNNMGTNVRDRIDGNYTLVLAADGKADQAISDATAAINTANSAEATAAAALEAVSYWETEFVIASAAVVLGVNELLIGPCQNVPGGLERIITDMHIAFLTQPNGLTFELKKWSADGTTDSVLGTYTVPAGATRASWAINYNVVHRERLFINVTSITGTVDPQVLQVLVFGAFVEAV
ncbi:hypothetical protein IU451_29310 [Nocardia cyriacigeorgica]|uniref:hypothetical protein n=1 Tax=Nocardia cyriacigeorgica TaxID=135487 RepID=UPI0018953D19|nr:hypothetical protein [Nocardia cyriacigeorgica]MBF6326600.1 hypothetical protein [Nocardia cyriacigeorgica]